MPAYRLRGSRQCSERDRFIFRIEKAIELRPARFHAIALRKCPELTFAFDATSAIARLATDATRNDPTLTSRSRRVQTKAAAYWPACLELSGNGFALARFLQKRSFGVIPPASAANSGLMRLR